MKIRCDRCGREVDEKKALARRVDDEDFYFCSKECLESSEQLDPSDDPERDERAGPAAGSAPTGGASE